MTPLQLAILVCLLLAGIATAMSALIPELTVMGIWGIPVLGFALLVGAIFRIAVYYDPREQASPVARKYTSYVAGSFLFHLTVWSTLDLIFQKEQHVAAIVGWILGVLTILGFLTFSEYVWVTKQTDGNVFPLIFELKRFTFFNSSSLFLIASVFGIEGLSKAVKPIVIFFAYANWISFAAVYSGIYRPQTVRASNGSIAERLNAWFHSKTRPGELFSSVQIVLTVIFLLWVILEAVLLVPSKYNLVSKGVFATITALSFYTATLYDPRKPHEASKLVIRLISVSAHFAVTLYFELYVEHINRRSSPYAFEVHSVTLVAFVFIKTLLILWMIFGELRADIIHKKILLVTFHITIYAMAELTFLLLHITNTSSIWKIVSLIFANIWYYYTTLYIIAAIAGKYREVARQEPPVQVQVQLEVVVEIQPPVVDQSLVVDPPFNRREKNQDVSGAFNV